MATTAQGAKVSSLSASMPWNRLSATSNVWRPGALALLEPEIAQQHPDILKPCLASPDPEFANLALVLHTQIEHIRRSADQQADLRHQLAALKAENESVRKQLNALKDIEKSIHERDKRPPRTSQ